MGKTSSRGIRQLWLHVVLATCSLFMVTPFIWQVLTAFKSVPESRAVPPVIFPSELHLEGFEHFFSALPLGRLLTVSSLALIMRVVGQVTVCSLAAYGFARFRFPGRSLLFGLFLIMLMAPSQLFLIAQFTLVRDLHLLDSIPAISLPGIFSAFGTFLLRQAFISVPREFEEAARLDGAGALRIFFTIMLPLTAPSLAALTVLTALYSWNDLLWPLVITSSPDNMTLPVGLATLQGQHGTDYPTLMAGSLLASLPLIATFILLQKQFFEGIASSGLKG